jgi:small subunit ribosomal protein S16
MLKLRLARMGRKNRPFYRIVALNVAEARDGSYLENLGWYDPLQKDKDKKVKIEVERYRHWISLGAQPSESLRLLLNHTGHVPIETKPAKHRRRAKRPKGKKPAAKK